MLNNIKYYAIAAFGVLSVILWALLNNERRKSAQHKLKEAKAARKTEKLINKATVEGLQREQNSKNNRDYDDDDRII